MYSYLRGCSIDLLYERVRRLIQVLFFVGCLLFIVAGELAPPAPAKWHRQSVLGSLLGCSVLDTYTVESRMYTPPRLRRRVGARGRGWRKLALHGFRHSGEGLGCNVHKNHVSSVKISQRLRNQRDIPCWTSPFFLLLAPCSVSTMFGTKHEFRVHGRPRPRAAATWTPPQRRCHRAWRRSSWWARLLGP